MPVKTSFDYNAAVLSKAKLSKFAYVIIFLFLVRNAFSILVNHAVFASSRVLGIFFLDLSKFLALTAGIYLYYDFINYPMNFLGNKTGSAKGRN